MYLTLSMLKHDYTFEGALVLDSRTQTLNALFILGLIRLELKMC